MASPIEKHPVFCQTFVTIFMINSCHILMEKNAVDKAKAFDFNSEQRQVRSRRKEDISQTQMKTGFY